MCCNHLVRLGRSGNQRFQYAAVRGIAANAGTTVCLPLYEEAADDGTGNMLKTELFDFMEMSTVNIFNIQNIDAAYRNGVKKFMFLGSSCIYPKHAEVPIKEDQLLTGPLEPTNDAYAIAKIAGIKMCESYREQYGFQTVSVMPCNLYGVNDNFHPENSTVIP